MIANANQSNKQPKKGVAYLCDSKHHAIIGIDPYRNKYVTISKLAYRRWSKLHVWFRELSCSCLEHFTRKTKACVFARFDHYRCRARRFYIIQFSYSKMDPSAIQLGNTKLLEVNATSLEILRSMNLFDCVMDITDMLVDSVNNRLAFVTKNSGMCFLLLDGSDTLLCQPDMSMSLTAWHPTSYNVMNFSTRPPAGLAINCFPNVQCE